MSTHGAGTYPTVNADNVNSHGFDFIRGGQVGGGEMELSHR